MSFAPIDISALSPSKVASVARRFYAAERGGMDDDDLSSDAIEELGGNGQVAIDLIDDWISSPYRSLLRWVISRATGQDVKAEFTRIQRRSEQSLGKYLAEWDARVLVRNVHKLNASELRLVTAATRKKTYDAAQMFVMGYNKGDVWLKISHRFITIDRQRISTGEMLKSIEQSRDKAYVNTVVAMSALSRAVPRRQPWLFRGICCAQGYGIHRKAKVGSVSIGTDHATSFTDNLTTAQRFSRGEGMTLARTKAREKSIVIRVMLPMASLIAMPRTFSSLRREHEWIIATDGDISVDAANISVVT